MANDQWTDAANHPGAPTYGIWLAGSTVTDSSGQRWYTPMGGSGLACPWEAIGGGSNASQSVVGPPTTGLHNAGETFIDANGSIWACSATGTPGTWFPGGSGVELAEAELSASSANVTTVLADVAGLSITFNAPARAFVLELYVPTVTVSVSTTLCQLDITDAANTIITQANAQGGTAQGTAGNLFLRGRLPKVGGTAPYPITVGQSYTFKVRAVTNAGTANLIDGSDIERPILRAVTC